MQIEPDEAREAIAALLREVNSATFDDVFESSFEIDESSIDELLAEIGVR